MSALYRLPWFLALSHLSRGAAWSVHVAARSRCEETGSTLLPRSELHLAFASLPAAVRRLALSALVAVGLWVEVEGGYEVRETPGEVRPSAPPPPPSGRPSKAGASSSAERVARYRAKRAAVTSGVASVTDPVASGPCNAGQAVASSVAGVTSSPSLSSDLSGKSGEEENQRREEGETARDATPTVTLDVTGRVTPATPVEQPGATPDSGNAPPSKPPAPPSPPAVAPPAPRPRRPRPSSVVLPPAVLEVFGYWRASLAPRAELTAERVLGIDRALTSGLSVADCKLAIDGCSKSDWHKHTGNTDLALILRPGKVERFLAWGRGEADPNGPPPSARPRVEPQPEHPGKLDLKFKPLDVQAVIARRKAEAALAASNNPSSKKDAAE